MPDLGPIKRKDLVYYLKQVGFEGPYSGGKHQFMIKEHLGITIPNPHMLFSYIYGVLPLIFLTYAFINHISFFHFVYVFLLDPFIKAVSII